MFPVARMGLAMLLASATVIATAQTMPTSGPVSGPMSGQATAAAPSSAPANYVLGPGDRIRITVFGEDRLSGEYVVTSNGELSFPLIGNFKATGLSVTDLQATLRSRLTPNYLKDARVSAEVLTFRPFYVLGEVARPGQYPYVEGLTLQQAIATAGGYTYRAKTSRIFVRPARQEAELTVKMKKEGGRLVMPGDTIRVGERFF